MKRVLFIHTQGGIGDLLLSSPIAEAIGRSWPGARVTAWVAPACRALLLRNPWFSDCLGVDDRASLAAQHAAIRKQRFDAAVLPWTTARETALVWLARIPVRAGQGGRLAYSWTFTHPVRVASTHGDDVRHWMDIQLDYARALGCRTDGVRPRLFLDDSERREARLLMERRGVAPGTRPFCLHIGKGLSITAERWPIARFVDVGTALCDAGRRLILTGSRSERAVVQAVASAIGNGAVMLAGETTMRQMCAVVAECAAVICPDSGPGHIAAALDVPVVSIFALKSAPVARWRPWGDGHRVVTTGSWICPKRCVKERCKRFDCLEAFDAGEVVRAALELVQPS